MPYFTCERCALRLYSAASETRCADCGAHLRKGEPALNATARAQPHRVRRTILWPQPQPLDEGGRG
jgi:hypothetical protein